VFRTLKQRGHNPVCAVLDPVRVYLKSAQIPSLPGRMTENREASPLFIRFRGHTAAAPLKPLADGAKCHSATALSAATPPRPP
jgi:hypothetical protein